MGEMSLLKPGIRVLRSARTLWADLKVFSGRGIRAGVTFTLDGKWVALKIGDSTHIFPSTESGVEESLLLSIFLLFGDVPDFAPESSIGFRLGPRFVEYFQENKSLESFLSGYLREDYVSQPPSLNLRSRKSLTDFSRRADMFFLCEDANSEGVFSSIELDRSFRSKLKNLPAPNLSLLPKIEDIATSRIAENVREFVRECALEGIPAATIPTDLSKPSKIREFLKSRADVEVPGDISTLSPESLEDKLLEFPPLVPLKRALEDRKFVRSMKSRKSLVPSFSDLELIGHLGHSRVYSKVLDFQGLPPEFPAIYRSPAERSYLKVSHFPWLEREFKIFARSEFPSADFLRSLLLGHLVDHRGLRARFSPEKFSKGDLRSFEDVRNFVLPSGRKFSTRTLFDPEKRIRAYVSSCLFDILKRQFISSSEVLYPLGILLVYPFLDEGIYEISDSLSKDRGKIREILSFVYPDTDLNFKISKSL